MSTPAVGVGHTPPTMRPASAGDTGRRHPTMWFIAGAIAIAAIVLMALITGVYLMFAGAAQGGTVQAVAVSQADYLRLEGPARRGVRFQTLTGQWAGHQNSGGVLTEAQMFKSFGPPDYQFKGNAKAYVYLYDRFGKKDWFVICTVGNGVVDRIGWNGVEALDFNNLEPFVPNKQEAGDIADE